MTTLESLRPRLGLRPGKRPETPVRVVLPRAPGPMARAREFWDSRRLIPYFALRFIRKMYMRTWLGRLWIPLRPILDVATRTIIFGGLLGVASEGIPYTLFLLVGALLWRLLSSTLYWMTRSAELNRRFLTRMYVPRLTLLTAAIGPPSVWFVMYAALTVIIFGYYWVADHTLYLVIGPALLVALAAIVLVLALCASFGLFTSVYGAQARDVRFGLNYIMGFWYFFTPVIYPLSTVPASYRTIMELNPMTAPMEMFRYGLFGTGGVPLLGLGVTIATIVVVGSFGLRFFTRSEAAALDSL